MADTRAGLPPRLTTAASVAASATAGRGVGAVTWSSKPAAPARTSTVSPAATVATGPAFALNVAAAVKAIVVLAASARCTRTVLGATGVIWLPG